MAGLVEQPCPFTASDSVRPRNLQRYRIDCTPERIASAGRALIPDKAAEHRGATVKLMMRVIGVLPGTG